MNSTLPPDYDALLSSLKARIRSARVRAALAANAELIHLYWDIGRMIVDRQEEEGWGKSVVERLSNDLRAEFPGQSGLSPQNLWSMRQVYLAWHRSLPILQQALGELEADPHLLTQPVSQALHRIAAETLPVSPEDSAGFLLRIVREIPWGQNIDLVTKIKDPVQRLWYALQTVENGWSRAVLSVQIETDLFSRQGAAQTNFAKTFSAPDSDLVQGLFKDRYLLDFIPGGTVLRERQLEESLTSHITRFLLQLGKGFAFVGRQYRLEVGGDELFLDLLFYHVRLHCYVIVDLKAGKFDPRDAGQINFYLEAVDRQVRNHEVDAPSIGLILCREKNHLVVEYALARTDRPTAVATWELTGKLPDALSASLPTVEQLEEEFSIPPASGEAEE